MRWTITGNGIEWTVNSGDCAHIDDIEMAGLGASFLVWYGIDQDGRLSLKRHPVWPTLRTRPNNTHASWQMDIPAETLPVLKLNGKEAPELPLRFGLDGVLTVISAAEDAEVERVLFPTAGTPGQLCRDCMEIITVTNRGQSPLLAALPGESVSLIGYERGTKGVYQAAICRWGEETLLQPGESTSFVLTYTAWIPGREAAASPVNGSEAHARLLQRRRRADQLMNDFSVLETGIPHLDRMFAFAKLRAGESIFDVACGLLHSPGGMSYYAASWCNDQVEYSGPWFGFHGDAISTEAALNAYLQYIPFMSEQNLSIPSSIIAEGTDFWEKDRGDEAMYIYGASQFALYSGSESIARRLYPAIKWCINYCMSRKNSSGVICSDTDELEGRFPTGEANLSTSSLCYGGLRYAACLAGSLGFAEDEQEFTALADALEEAIEAYFGAEIHGYATYRYYDGCEILRSWICLPLVMGLNARAQGTLDALTSDRLWTADGLLTAEGDKTFWDRSTLYGFRGAFLGGAGDRIFAYFDQYSRNRLLGERVPYPIEAWPEGSKRHLSAESALYCRIIPEGILGIRPQSLHSFRMIPRLPAGLPYLKLSRIHAFGAVFSIEVDTDGCRVISDGRCIARGNINEEMLIQF